MQRAEPNSNLYQPVEGANLSAATCLTKVRIQRAVAGALAAIALIGAAVLIGVAAAGFIASPVGWVAVPIIALALIGGGAIWYAATRKDYEDPKEVAQMKEKALNQNFHQLYKAHGPRNLINHIFNEPGTDLSHESLQNKFKAEARRLTLESATYRYNIGELDALGIAPHAWVEYTTQETQLLNQERAAHSQASDRIDREYPGRTDRIERQTRRLAGQVHFAYSLSQLGNTDRNRARNNFFTHAAIDAGASAIGYFAGNTESARDQQRRYNGEMAAENTRHGQEIRGIYDRYNQNSVQYLN
ncbi:MAG: hypothetical protein JSS32_07785 [Verrucomicrobia bacterium]|nr:hypothetical protein [Verrucomicrobiota bacterium]